MVEKARNAFLDFEVLVTMIETHSAELPLKLSILRDDYSLNAEASTPQRPRETPESSPLALLFLRQAAGVRECTFTLTHG